MFQQSASDLQPFLNRLISRSVLTTEERQAALDLPTTAFEAVRNEDFVRLGERVDHACFIVAGLVGRFDQNSNGDRQITALHIPGDVPDLLSVVQPTPTSALQALSSTTLLQISHAALRKVAGNYPAVAEAFWRDCTVDGMVVAQWVVNLGRRNAIARIAHLLCEMAFRYQVDLTAAEVKFELGMTQDQVANATGLTPIHVNRSLKRLQEIGRKWRLGTVRIDDWQALQKAADFDPNYLQVDTEPDHRLRIALPAT